MFCGSQWPQKGLLPLHSSQSHKGIFPGFSLGKHGRVLGGKAPMEVCEGPPITEFWGVCCSHAHPHLASSYSSLLLLKCSYKFITSGVFFPHPQPPVSRSWGWVSVGTSLSRFMDGSLPCDFSSLMGPRKANDFQFVWLFSCCKNGSDNFQALYILELKLEVLVDFL